MITDEAVVDVSQDWLQACSVQERLMRAPAPAKERLEYSVSCRQLRSLGGDCYDFTWLADGRLAFLIGDASGKGVAAALMMAGVQASLRTASLFTGDDLPALLRAANLQVCYSSPAGRFATLFCGTVDPATGKLRYVNAGHNPPLVLHADSDCEWLETTGAPVGLFPDGEWTERTVQLRPGDRIVVYTDGVTETFSPAGDEWGAEGLLRSAREHAPESPDAMVGSILDAAYRFSQGAQCDDATLAVIRVL